MIRITIIYWLVWGLLTTLQIAQEGGDYKNMLKLVYPAFLIWVLVVEASFLLEILFF